MLVDIKEERIIELIKAWRMAEEITGARFAKGTVAKCYSDTADALRELVALRKAYERACDYLASSSSCPKIPGGCRFDGSTCEECWSQSILKEVIENDD